MEYEKIKQLAKDIYEQKSCDTSFEENCENLAYELITIGYRKESDTAREILEMYRLEDTFSSFQEKVAKKYGLELE